MSERKTITYGPELWAQGTRGEQSALLGKAYIENMQVYTSGLLGPRPKWKAYWSYTSSAQYSYFRKCRAGINNPAIDCFVASGAGGVRIYSLGILEHIWQYTSAAQGPVWQMPETDLVSENKQLSTVIGLQSGGGPYDLTATTLDWNADYGYTYYDVQQALIWQGRAWYIGQHIVVLTDHDYVTWRIHYSDLYDWDTFTDSGYFDLDDGPLIGMSVIGNDLVVWSMNGKYYRLVSSGGPVDSISVVPMVDGRIPRDNLKGEANSGIVKVDDVVFFLSGYSNPGIVTALTREGVDDKSLAHLATKVNPAWPEDPAGSSESNTIWLPYREHDGDWTDPARTGPLYGYVFHNNAWYNDETMDFSVDADDRVVGTAYGIDGSDVLMLFHQWDTGGSPATNTYLYTRDVTLNRPSKDGDTYSNGDEEMYVDGVLSDVTQSGSVHLPRIQGQSTQQYVRIDKISIDAEYWKDSGGNYPTVAVTVTVLDQEGTSNSFTTDLSAAGLANAEPGHVRITAFTDGLAFTPWSEVKLTAIDSLALEMVHIDFSVEDRAW